MDGDLQSSPGAPDPVAMDDVQTSVLLIDDQPLVGEAVRRALVTQPDIAFEYCQDSSNAEALAERVAPTVILQDLVMPDVDGMTLVRAYRLNPRIRDVPIIVLSTKEDPAVKRDAFASGASDYLVKLPDPVELIARIRHHSKAYRFQLQRDAAYRALRESQRKLLEINARLERLSNVDGLTGLSNRRYFDEYVAAQWKVNSRQRTPLSILMIDVDDFKKYNDTYGHLAGDTVLRSVAAAIQASFRRPTDLAARFGGEEFVVVLPATPQAGLRALGEHLIASVAELNIPHSAASAADHVTVSVGGATTIPRWEDPLAALIQTADEALYEAKRSGKNRIATRDPEPATAD
jgi:two-component system chemotaxis family response regulator WspR